jgi:pimeloyl-ACP methyl ester carboxylesterase
MKRWEITLAIAGALLLGLSAWAIHRNELPRRDFVLTAGGCNMPVTVLATVRPRPRAGAIIFHGLSANRRVMQTLGSDLALDASLRVYLVDLPGHGDNTDRFTFARDEECADIAVESMIRSGEIDPKTTIVIGHSMGGAIAIRLADREPVAATIAISPAPMILPRRMPANLLVFSAQGDIDVLKRQALQLSQAAGGERTTTEDFVQARAFHLEVVSLSDHTSVLFDPRVLQDASDWSADALDAESRKAAGLNQWNEQLRLDYRSFVIWGAKARFLLLVALYAKIAPLFGCVGILMLFPFCATIASSFAGRQQTKVSGAQSARLLVLAEGAVCALAAALILALFVPLKFLHIYAGDYLASLLLIAGALLLALNWKSAKEGWPPGARPLVAAAILGFATFLAFGAWLNWQLTDMWMNAPRWLRFAALVPIVWIFCFAEEVVLGPVGKGWARAARVAVSLALRAELWLACLLTYYALGSEQVLILILVTALALFSILQRVATDALRLRTGSAGAAALFDAILAAWFIAAVFPLT